MQVEPNYCSPSMIMKLSAGTDGVDHLWMVTLMVDVLAYIKRCVGYGMLGLRPRLLRGQGPCGLAFHNMLVNGTFSLNVTKS